MNTMHSREPSPARGHGPPRAAAPGQPAAFTRSDLLAVLAVLSLLGGLAWPAFSETGLRASAATCLDNLRRLSLAWTSFAEDHQGELPRNLSGGPSGQPAWVSGWLDYGSSPDNTNTLYLLDPRYAQLGPYTKDASLYRCPADESQARIGGVLRPRVRSYSMSNAMNPYPSDSWLPSPPYQVFRKLNAISDPPPSRCYVFLEEHPDSINDGLFAFQMPASPAGTWLVDYPGSHHDYAGAFAFADNHVELHRWQDARTMPPVRSTYLSLNVPQPNNPDILWMAARCTSRRQ